MMNTPLKFDHEKRSNFQFERSDFRAHYEDWAAHALQSIGRHRGLIASLVAIALATRVHHHTADAAQVFGGGSHLSESVLP